MQKELVKYILGKNYSFLYGDLFPLFDYIFSNEIRAILKLVNTKEIFYYEFNSEIFNIINNYIKNEDSLNEMIIFYFENKIMNELNKKQIEQEKYFEKNIESLRYFVDFIEKKYAVIEKYSNLLYLNFAIAFVKCYIFELIKIMKKLVILKNLNIYFIIYYDLEKI